MSAIVVEHLGKRYRIGAERLPYRTLRDEVADLLLKPIRALRNRPRSSDEFRALEDVSFQVEPGEVIGVIGRNGAGKSTLLKIISRITRPTSGRIRLRGRVGSLLEVGTGFHPELTGRENIFLSGAVLGMTRREILAKFDEIVAFAEVERFLDLPVKRYSSGMYMRLGFAVAAHIEPEILLVDEVLAVGDANFQKKCLTKMGAGAREGRTVLFVSHNMTAVEALCSRVIWLAGGKVFDTGPAGPMVRKYLAESRGVGSQRYEIEPSLVERSIATLLFAEVVAIGGGEIFVDTPIQLRMKMWNPTEGAILNFSISIWTAEGVRLFNTFCLPAPTPRGEFQASCDVPGHLMNAGEYTVEILVVAGGVEVIQAIPDALTFEVNDIPREGGFFGPAAGLIRPRVVWKSGKEVRIWRLSNLFDNRES